MDVVVGVDVEVGMDDAERDWGVTDEEMAIKPVEDGSSDGIRHNLARLRISMERNTHA